MDLYLETGRAKIKPVQQYVSDLAIDHPERKFLVFAHHQDTLDGIESCLQEQVCIRIICYACICIYISTSNTCYKIKVL